MSPFCTGLFVSLALLDFTFLSGQALCNRFSLFPLLCGSTSIYYSKQKIMRAQPCKTPRNKMVIFLKGTEKNWDIVDCFGGFHPRKCHRSCPFSTLFWTSPSVELDGAGGGVGGWEGREPRRRVASGWGRVHSWKDGTRSPC